jgi:hypothetical protein
MIVRLDAVVWPPSSGSSLHRGGGVGTLDRTPQNIRGFGSACRTASGRPDLTHHGLHPPLDMSAEVLDGAGHFIPDEAPATVAARVIATFG